MERSQQIAQAIALLNHQSHLSSDGKVVLRSRKPEEQSRSQLTEKPEGDRFCKARSDRPAFNTVVYSMANSSMRSQINEASSSYPVYAPPPGWSESEPSDWWSAVAVAVTKTVEHRVDLVKAIAFTRISQDTRGEFTYQFCCQSTNIAVLSCMDYTVGARYIVPLRITVLHSIENRYIVNPRQKRY
jgi:hypothetical protein